VDKAITTLNVGLVKRSLDNDDHLNQCIGAAKSIITKASAAIVTNDDELVEAGNLKRYLTTSLKSINTAKRGYSQPLSEITKVVNQHFKEHTTQHKAVAAGLDKKINGYIRQKEAENAMKVAEITAALCKEDAEIVEKAFGRARKHQRSEDGNRAYSRRIKKWKVSSFSKIPEEYLTITVDEKKVDKAVKQGIAVDGIHVYYEIASSVRHTEV